MRVSSYRLSASAALAGATGLLTYRYSFDHLPDTAARKPSSSSSCPATPGDASLTPSQSYPSIRPAPSPTTVSSDTPTSTTMDTHVAPTRKGARWLPLLPSWPASLAPPLPLLTPCKADGSGYDAMQPADVRGPAARAATLGGSELRDSVYDTDPDTITGVFHRLDPPRAQLVLVQAVFRHGARTPLSNRREMWGGQQWDVCGEAYQAAAVRLFSTAGVEDPVSKHDVRQRSVVLDGGCRKGELTLLGQTQARDLGRWLRARYVGHYGFLPASDTADVVEARTTNVSRTIATLRGVLTGLDPDLPTGQSPAQQQQQQPGGQQQQSPPVKVPAAGGVAERQPLRVTTSGDLDEILYADSRACPHLSTFTTLAKELRKTAMRSDPDYPWAREELMRLLGMDPATFDMEPWIFTDVHDNLTSLAAHGKRLPPGFADQPRLLAVINRLATKEFSSEVAPSVSDALGRSVLRLSMGRLLHTLVGNMRVAAAAAAETAGGAAGAGPVAGGAGPAEGGSSTEGSRALGSRLGADGALPRMYLYSGHDSTVMPLLSAFGVDVVEWPPYISNLVLELWQVPPPSSAPSAAAPEQQPASPPADGGSGGAQPSSAAAAAAPPRYVVRVLFNLQELPLPHCPPGYLPSLATFEREVVGPFLLSAQHHQELCRVKVEHDDSMPQPQPHHQAHKPKADKQGKAETGAAPTATRATPPKQAAAAASGA